MKTFANILVGVDIDKAGELAAGSRAAVDKALWLSAQTGAHLCFVHVIDVPEAVREVMRMQPQSEVGRRQRQVAALLERLAASTQGGTALTRILYGRHWKELIAEVLRGGHDLVLIGTRGRGVAGRALFGSTGNRLLRLCPCPVWTVKAGPAVKAGPLLVAHDLSDVGARALQLGSALARLQGSELHVLHVLEHPEDDCFLGSISRPELEGRRQQALAELGRQCRDLDLPSAPRLEVTDGNAHAAILDYTTAHAIELLCMGTVARSGLAGLLTGNTAENVLPWVQCSLLAVKPTGFASSLAAGPGVIDIDTRQRKTAVR